MPTRAPVTAATLATLTDFGQSATNQDQPSAIGLSPDGDRAALLVREPDVARNIYCQALVVVPLDGSAAPLIIPIEAQPILWAPSIRGLLTPNGSFVANPPRWSPDGRTIAFRGLVAGEPQVMAIDLFTRVSRVLTSVRGGVDDFGWSRDGRAIVYATRPALPAEDAALDREARSGFHYDRRVSPMFAVRPMTPADLSTSYRAYALNTGADRLASAEERSILEVAGTLGRPAGVPVVARDRAGHTAWFAPLAADRSGTAALALTLKNRTAITHCAARSCRGGLIDVWWMGDSVIYLRREGWANSLTAIYRWRLGRAPKRLFRTTDALLGCDLAGTRLICGREASRAPRRLWSLDIVTGIQNVVLDPNPTFASHALARVARLRWRGPRGIKGYGDLVVPDGRPPPSGFPLIVVQYRTRGFLRGGIGDEYPIFAFAARGFAVLSVEEANYDTFAGSARDQTMLDAMRAAAAGHAERHLQQANLEAGIQRARSMIPIDPDRMGITGISDAASSAVFAINAGTPFSAAALGTPVVDSSVLALGGHALQEQFRFMGYPSTLDERADFYRPLTLVLNATRMKLPLLFQWSDTEYLGGMTAVTALEEARVPVDLYVFPNEFHVKSQPAHRLAAYERNLDWFDFWFNRRETLNPSNAAQYVRWRSLRGQACTARPAPRIRVQLCSQASTSTSADRRE